MKLVCKLKNLMEERHISQIGLAQETGLAPGTVGKLYRNQINRIDENTLKQLCLYFGLKSVGQLIEIEWEPGDESPIRH